MGALTLALTACAHVRAPVPTAAAAEGPRWPPPPDPARVAWVGAVDLPDAGRPLDVACAPGALAVTDPDAGAVWLVGLDDGRIRRAPRRGAAPVVPVGAEALPDGTVWVADAETGRVVALDPSHRRWTAQSPAGGFVRPTATVHLPDLRAAVVDAGAHSIVVLDPRSGATLPVGQRGPVGAGFNFPVDAVAEGGALLVADALNAVVQRVTLDGGQPTFVAGGPGQGGALLVRPKGLALDGSGRLHVVDAGMQHVQVYDPRTGALLGRYGGPGSGPGELTLPAGLCIAGSTVFVADSVNRRIQIYDLLGEDP